MTWAYKFAYRDKGIALSTQALKELQTSKRVFKVLCLKKNSLERKAPKILNSLDNKEKYPCKSE